MGEYAGVVGGIGTMMSVRQRPWHWNENQDRIRVVEHNVTSGAQALTLAGIGWGVEKISLEALTIGLQNADEYCVVIREDTKAVLGVHKKGYGPIQNQALADLADGVIMVSEGAFIDTAGSLFEPGKVVWMLVRLGDSTSQNLDSKYEPWLLIATSHDGRMALSARFVKVRVVCMNTFAMAFSGTQALYTVRHTTNADEYVAQAREAVAMAVANDKAMDQAIEKMLDTPYTADRLLDTTSGLITDVAGKRPGEEGTDQRAWDRMFDGIVEAYTAEHNLPIFETAWGAVNAFQEYEQWGVRTRKPLAQVQMGRLLEGQWPLTARALKALAPV